MILMRGIYAHRNKLNNVIFYVGKQETEYDRSHDFFKQRNDKYLNLVKEIGIENIEVIWLYISNNDEPLNKIEKYFQEVYFALHDDLFLCSEFVAYGVRNPNFGNKWTKEQKEKLSKKRKTNEKSKGKNNSRAIPCTLYFPDGSKKDFDYLGEMRKYFYNLIGGKARLSENNFIPIEEKFIPYKKREIYKKSIGFYYKRR